MRPGKRRPSARLEAWPSRSGVGGRTWSVGKSFRGPLDADFRRPIPFGDVARAADGSLCVAAYAGPGHDAVSPNSSYLYRSRDDGRTWGEGVIIGKGDYNKTAPLHLGGGR